MKKALSILMLAMWFLLGGTAEANASTIETGNMDGYVGSYPVVMKLTINDSTGKVTGWYYYKSKGSKNKIQLSGTYRDEGLGGTMTLTEKVKGKVTGTFSGEFWIAPVGNMGYNGTWKSPSGKRLEFDVNWMWR